MPTNDIESPQEQLQKWRSKGQHGKYISRIEYESVDNNAYLRYGSIFPENIKCRICANCEETLDHVNIGHKGIFRSTRPYTWDSKRVVRITSMSPSQYVRTKRYGSSRKNPEQINSWTSQKNLAILSIWNLVW